MSRALPAIIVGLASFGACLGAGMLALAMPAASGNSRDCPLAVERFFASETVAPDGRLRVSYYALLHNPGPRAQAYGLHFTHAAATDRRSGARASLPGERSLPVLLGREILPPDGAPLSPDAMAAAMELNCRA